MIDETEIILGLLSLAGVIYAAYIGSAAYRKKNAIQLENRLTKLETTRFTEDDRRCLYELRTKMNLFWSIIEKEVPKMLLSAATPMFDILLIKASEGIHTLTSDELTVLRDGLKEEYDKALSIEDGGRAYLIRIYQAVIEAKLAPAVTC